MIKIFVLMEPVVPRLGRLWSTRWGEPRPKVGGALWAYLPGMVSPSCGSS